jgi:hypothetical protein
LPPPPRAAARARRASWWHRSRVEEKAEDGLEFNDEVLVKPSHGEAPTRRAQQQWGEPLDVVSARHRQPVLRDGASVITITRGQRCLEDRFHRGDKGLSGGVEQQDATAAQQMGETRLVRRLMKLPVRLPPVALPDTRTVDADHVRRPGEAAARLNRKDGRLRCDKGPEPLQIGRDAPTRFIGGDHGAAPDGGAQGFIGRLRLTCRAMHRVHHPAARDPPPESVTEQRRDLP